MAASLPIVPPIPAPARAGILPADREAILLASSLLEAGELVGLPTETVYGLGCDGLQPAAIRKVFEAKARPMDHPLILHVSGLPMARALAARWTETAQRLVEAYWPGPLTLVVPASPVVPPEVRAGGPTVAVRMPAHPAALALLRRLDRPIAAPSANRHQGVSPTTAMDVLEELGGKVALILDGGPCEQGLESTVVDLSGDRPRILRPGPVTATMLRRWVDASEAPVVASGPRPSPGLSPRHYAPRMPLILSADPEAEAARRRTVGLRVARLARARVEGLRRDGDRWELPDHPAAFARGLYLALHAIQAAGPDCLVVDTPPEGPAWEAVRDRLRRASHPAGPSPSQEHR